LKKEEDAAFFSSVEKRSREALSLLFIPCNKILFKRKKEKKESASPGRCGQKARVLAVLRWVKAFSWAG
jgi:hypothetical protein